MTVREEELLILLAKTEIERLQGIQRLFVEHYDLLEILLKENQIGISPEKAIEAINEIKQLRYILPKSQQVKTKILQPTEMQPQLINMKI